MNNKVYVENNLKYSDNLIQIMGDAIEKLGQKSLFKTGEKVLIKINVAGPFPVEQAATTNPEVVRAIIRLLKEAGAKPYMGETPNSKLPSFQISGFEQLSIEEDVELIKFSEFKNVKCQGEIFDELEYAQDILEADRLISAAKMKTHALVYYTGATKNMFGAIPPRLRKKFHLNRSCREFSNSLLDVYTCRKPDLAIVDGIVAMQGMGPTHGDAVYTGMLAVSADALAVDKVCAQAIGYPIKQIPIFQEAQRRNLCNIHEDDIINGNLILPTKLKLVPIMEEGLKSRFLKAALGSPTFDLAKCKKCRICLRFCPASAIKWTNDFPDVEGDKCINCYCCHELCPVGAVEFKRRRL